MSCRFCPLDSDNAQLEQLPPGAHLRPAQVPVFIFPLPGRPLHPAIDHRMAGITRKARAQVVSLAGNAVALVLQVGEDGCGPVTITDANDLQGAGLAPSSVPNVV